MITQELMKKKAYFKQHYLNSDNSFKLRLLPTTKQELKHQPATNSTNSSNKPTIKESEQQPSVESATSSVKSDIKKSDAWKAYLASKKERFEVYRRLAES